MLGDRKLEDIHNPRLVRLKEKTLNWRFKVIHVAGKIHVGPDTLSRKEVSESVVNVFRLAEVSSDSDMDIEVDIEAQVAANVPHL